MWQLNLPRFPVAGRQFVRLEGLSCDSETHRCTLRGLCNRGTTACASAIPCVGWSLRERAFVRSGPHAANLSLAGGLFVTCAALLLLAYAVGVAARAWDARVGVWRAQFVRLRVSEPGVYGTNTRGSRGV